MKSDCTVRTSCRKLKSRVPGESCAIRLEQVKKARCPGGDASIVFEGWTFEETGKCEPCINKDPKIRPNKQAIACGVADKALSAVVKAAKYATSPVHAIKAANKAGKIIKNGFSKAGKQAGNSIVNTGQKAGKTLGKIKGKLRKGKFRI